MKAKKYCLYDRVDHKVYMIGSRREVEREHKRLRRRGIGYLSPAPIRW